MSLQQATVTLFREAFEGREEGKDYTWFVEGREAILPTLEGIDAMTASHSPGSGLPSIAAHAYHIRYSLQWLNVPAGGTPPEGNWESTWEKQTVTDEEWSALLADIKDRYRRGLKWLGENEDWSVEGGYTMFLGPLPHMAYHLGAIRVLLKVIH